MDEILSSSIRDEQRIWAKPDSVRFFQNHRQKPEDLYPSERVFLPELLPRVASCLDIWCAAGGFSRIMKSFNPELAYTGVDINEEFIAIARRAYPDCCFEVGDGVHFATPPNSFDLVFSSGILHLNSRYRDIVRAAYAQTKRFLLCDFRLTRGPSVVGRFDLDFDGSGNVPSELPYIVVNVDELLNDLRELMPHPAAITLKGYPHRVRDMARGVPSEVIMAFALIEKLGAVGTSPRIEVDLQDETAWGQRDLEVD